MKTLALITILALSYTARAERPAQLPACQAPVAACKAAGFKVGEHHKGDKEGADNGLWVDCIDAVADGKKQVAGVDQTAAQGCKAAVKAQKGK